MAIVDPKNTHSALVITGEPGHTLAEGIGCNLLISNQSALPELGDPERWPQVIQALEDLQVGWMRVGVIPTAEGGAWDDKAQVWDFAHPHMQVAAAIGRWAQDAGIRLMFDPFVVPPSFRRGGAYFADDPQQVAGRLILPVFRWLRSQGLTCYRYLGLLNERIWGPDKEGLAAVPEFYRLYEAVRAGLDAQGFDAAGVGLLGPSSLSSWEWPIADFFAAGLDPDPLWVGYDQHLYLYHFDWMQENTCDFMSLTELSERYLRRYADYAHKRGKPLFITELGNMYCGRLFWGERDLEGPATHTSVLMDAELIVRAINQGVDGFLRWALCVKPECDGRWSLLENTAQGMMASPSAYPMYRLLMHAVRPGARVLASRVHVAEGAFRYVFSAAVENRDGQAALLLINDMPGKDLNVGLKLSAPFGGVRGVPGFQGQLQRTVCDEMRKGVVLPPVALSEEGEGVVMLPPSSLTVLSTSPL
ncbi:MAG: hypothetical protein WD042_19710 [Phycisphaeraceae bacterium]